MENRVIIDNELAELKKELSTYVREFRDSIDGNHKFLITNDSIDAFGWLDAFRFFLQGWKEYSSPVKDLVLSSAYRINKSCPLALPLYFSVICGENAQVISTPRRPKSSELITQLKRLDDRFISQNLSILTQAVQTAGAAGNIVVQTGHHKNSVSVESGFSTLCILDEFFVPFFETQQVDDCKIIVYDGAIIEISEIHHILQEAYDTKQRVILVCSSISRDVSNTLFVNWQKGSTYVIPFIVEDGLDTINEMKDICSVINEIPITKQSGLRLSNVVLKEKNGHEIRFDSNNQKLNILLDGDQIAKVIALKSRIAKALEKETVDDVKAILQKRISKLSSRTVTVSLNEKKSIEGLIQDKASCVFTYFQKCAQQGIVEVGNDYFLQYLPSSEANKAIKFAEADLKALNSIKAVVKLDEVEKP